MKNLIHIGDVIIGKGRPPKENPYHAISGDRSNLKTYVPFSIMGDERRELLSKFKNGTLDLMKYSVWYAPCNSGAKELFDNQKIDWESSGV